MISFRKRKNVLKNKQDKFLPFLLEKNIKIEKKYAPYSKQTKALLDEQKAKKKARNKKILSVGGLVLNLVILAVILIVQLSQNPTAVLTPEIDWRYMAVIIGLVVLISLIDATKIGILIKTSTKKTRAFLAYKTSALGRYYDNITPMSTGGQPFQIFYMNKRGVRGDIATGIPLVRYITWQIAYVFVCSFALIYNSVKFGGTADPITTTAAWIATIFNLMIFATIILLSVSKRLGPKIVIWILKLLSKMHIIKNYRKTFRKVMRFVVNYQKTFKTLLKNPFVLMAELLLSVGDIVACNLFPYFIVRTLVPTAEIEIFKTFIQALICNLALGFIPTPGASGAAEGVFMLVFAGLFPKGLFWPVLIWRLATYYAPLGQGLLVLLYDFAIGNKKYERRQKAGLQLEQAGAKETFKQSLQNNMQTIEVVQAQESDTIPIPIQILAGVNAKNPDEKEIIENSSLVSNEEMDEKVRPAERVIDELHEKELKKKQIKNEKKQLRKEHKKKRFRRIKISKKK